MNRQLIVLFSTLITLLVLSACGGVASNPTAPVMTPPGGQPGGPAQPGAAGNNPLADMMGQLSGIESEQVDRIIEGTFETLYPQAMDAMDQGDVVMASQYFMSAHDKKKDSADAALAYAVTDVLRDHRRYAVFMHPGVDNLFFCTSLIGHPELFPNPFLAEDSYFLRLAALGNRTRMLKPATRYPILSPVDSETVFNPITYRGILESGRTTQINPGQPIEVTPNGGTGTGTGPDPAAPLPAPQHPPVVSPPDGVANQNAGMMGGPQITRHASGKQGRTDPRSTPFAFGSVNEGGAVGMQNIELPVNPSGELTERVEPLSDTEWETLIREYRDAAARDGADMFLSGMFYNNVKNLHDEIKQHIRNLEAVRTIVEQEGYTLSLPFSVLDGTQKITMSFDVDDYNLILDHFKLLDSLLSYVVSFDTTMGFRLPLSPFGDTDKDGILSPDEYIPALPFGTISDENIQLMPALESQLVATLTSLNNHMQPLIDKAQTVRAGEIEPKEIFYLSTFHRNYILIEEWNTLMREIANKTSSGISMKLASGPGVSEVVVKYDALYKNPVSDIRTFLPAFDYNTSVVILDDDGNWNSDGTFNGFFPEGLETPDSFTAHGRLTAVIYTEEMGRATNYTLNAGAASGTSNDKGIVAINSAVINELIGSPLTVLDAEGKEVFSGTVRTNYIIVPLFDINQLRMFFQADPEAIPVVGEGTSGEMTTTNPPAEAGLQTPPTNNGPGDSTGGPAAPINPGNTSPTG